MSECLNIMKERGYTLVNETDNYTLMKTNDEKMVIIFNCDEGLTIHNMKVYLRIMSDHNICNCIIIYSVHHFAKR